MNSLFSVLMLVSALLMQSGFSAFADGAGTDPDTGAGRAVWQGVSIPFRIVSGAAGIVIGAVGGSAKGIIRTEEKFGQATFGKADQNAWLVPAGILGTVVAVPAGIVTGAPEGAEAGAKYGYNVWDKF